MSLFGTLSISVGSLFAEQAALEASAENIANVNTQGYARRRVVLAENNPALTNGHSVGAGVHVQSIESLRDRVLELRLHDETQQQGGLQGYLSIMQQVDTSFSDVQNGLGAAMDNFFNSFSALSAQPGNMPLRQSCLLAGNNMAQAFQSAAKKLFELRKTADTSVVQSISQINALAGHIATLNEQISTLKNSGGDGSTFEDQRTEAIRSLAKLIDVKVIETQSGSTVTVANGNALVVGNQAFTLTTDPGPSADSAVLSEGVPITSDISGGMVGGLLRARDQALPSLISDLNTLATSLASTINSIHEQGYDLNGNQGGFFFAQPSPTDAALGLKMSLSDPSKLAASSAPDAQDAVNCLAMMNVRTGTVTSGKTPIEFYAGMVATIGNDVATATSDLDAGNTVLQQLADQRGAISGVSLDEEASNMIRYQRAFEASARIVSVVDELTQTIIAMGSN